VVTPALIAFLASHRLRRHPHGAYRLLRWVDPVHLSPLGVVVLSRHHDVDAALRNPGLGSDESKADFAALKVGPLSRVLGAGPDRPDGPFFERFSQLLLFRDPPDHTRLRRLVATAFTPRVAQSLAPRIETLIDELLAPLTHRREVELMSEFAYPLPVRVICELLGIPTGDATLFVHHAPALATGLDPSPMRAPAAIAAANRAAEVIVAYLDDLIARRRDEPGDDLLSRLIAAEDDGDTLSHDELVTTILLLLIAGHETTANLIGNGLVALHTNPRERDRLRDEPNIAKSAVEELLRYDGPVQMAERITLQPVELGRHHVPAGRIVVLCIGAANRDPAVFDTPDRLNLTRAPNPHLAFGAGGHFCLGAPLARIEAELALPALLQRLPDLTTGRIQTRWRPSFTIRGLSELSITRTPTVH
jgi:cytochrome P450